MTSYAKEWLAADMTLRDYFAAQALGGIIAGAQVWVKTLSNTKSLVTFAYQLADAMLAEREKEKSKP